MMLNQTKTNDVDLFPEIANSTRRSAYQRYVRVWKEYLNLNYLEYGTKIIWAGNTTLNKLSKRQAKDLTTYEKPGKQVCRWKSAWLFTVLKFVLSWNMRHRFGADCPNTLQMTSGEYKTGVWISLVLLVQPYHH